MSVAPRPAPDATTSTIASATTGDALNLASGPTAPSLVVIRTTGELPGVPSANA